MLQGEHSAIFSIFIKLPSVIKKFVLSIFEWLLKTGLTVYVKGRRGHALMKKEKKKESVFRPLDDNGIPIEYA